MGKQPSIVPKRVLAAIAKYVRDGRERPPVDYQDPETDWSFVPDVGHLRAVINAVFWASLEHEELRPVLPRVALGDPREHDCRIAATSLTALRRLSPFFDRGINVVFCSNNLQLVGIGPLNDTDVCVRAERPGVIVVSYLRSVLAVLEEDGWHLLNRDVDGFAGVLEGIFGGTEPSVRLQRAHMLITIAQWARAARRGAMFVTIPADADIGLELPAPYPVEAFAAGPEAFVATETERASVFEVFDNPWGYHQKRLYAKTLRDLFATVVSAGGGIDGAAVLDETDLRPLGFGVKIIAPVGSQRVRLLRFPVTKPVWVEKKSLGGTRHQSAAHLVQLNNKANVVTVSQDGTISWFTWGSRERCVLVVKYVDRFLRAEPN